MTSIISAAQVRAGRGLLGWSQQQLAGAAGVTRATINNLEAEQGRGSGKSPSAATRTAVREALELAGVELTPDGVRLRR